MSHILLLEPNTLLARSYTQALEHAGHSVMHVIGAQTAIDAADKNPPDVAIVELYLPGHSGIEFLHEFRSYAEWSDVPVILNTNATPGQLTPVIEVLQRDLGICEILYKPRTSLQELARMVRRYTVVT